MNSKIPIPRRRPAQASRLTRMLEHVCYFNHFRKRHSLREAWNLAGRVVR